MEIIDRGVAFFGPAEGEYTSACFPDVCVLPNGRWLVSFRASSRKSNAHPQRFMMTWSDDEGQTWHEPVEPFPARTVNGAPGMWRGGYVTSLGGERAAAVIYWVDVSDMSLPFFNEETEGLLDSRIFLATSDDSGQTWSEPQLIDTTPFNIPTPITGPILILPNNEWALQFETNKTYYDTSVWHHASILMFSDDQGTSWPAHVVTGADHDARYFYWDQRPAVFADGTVCDVFWTFDRKEAVYLNMHICTSQDNGRTWSELRDIGLPGQPAPPVMLTDGRIVMPYVDREDTPVIKLRTSSDGGRTWPAETEILLDDNTGHAQQYTKSSMQEAWQEMAAFSIGLPQTALLPGGDVLVAYYAGPATDHTGIHWVRVGAKR